MKYFGQFTYVATVPVRDAKEVRDKMREPDVTIEAHDESIGICIPADGAELRYFNATEVRMIAHALLSMIGDGDA